MGYEVIDEEGKSVECSVTATEEGKEINQEEEIDYGNIQEGNSRNSKEMLYSSFPVHSIVLCVHSQFFQKMFTESGMKESNDKMFVLKVPDGYGKYLELLIASFYDQSVFEMLKEVEDVLKVLDMAERYCCLSFIEDGLFMLSKMKYESIECCNMTLDRNSRFKSILHPISKEAVKDMCEVEKSCLMFLAEAVTPLECHWDQIINLSYYSLLLILRFGSEIAFSEDTVISFAYGWLLKMDHKPGMVKGIVECFRYPYASKTFLCERLSGNDEIFSKWSGYAEWLLNAVSYHVFSPGVRRKRGYMEHELVFRNIVKPDVLNQYIFSLPLLEDGDNVFTTLMVKFRHAGFTFGVRVSTETNKSNDDLIYKYHVELCKPSFLWNAKNMFINETLSIMLAILPGNITYTKNLFEANQFALRKEYFSRVKVVFTRRDSLGWIFSLCDADTEFHNICKTHGINLAIAIGSSEESLKWIEQQEVNKYVVELRGQDNYSPIT